MSDKMTREDADRINEAAERNPSCESNQSGFAERADKATERNEEKEISKDSSQKC